MRVPGVALAFALRATADKALTRPTNYVFPSTTALSRRRTSEHIRKFWNPRMRKAIFAYLDAGGAKLESKFAKQSSVSKSA